MRWARVLARSQIAGLSRNVLRSLALAVTNSENTRRPVRARTLRAKPRGGASLVVAVALRLLCTPASIRPWSRRSSTSASPHAPQGRGQGETARAAPAGPFRFWLGPCTPTVKAL